MEPVRALQIYLTSSVHPWKRRWYKAQLRTRKECMTKLTAMKNSTLDELTNIRQLQRGRKAKKDLRCHIVIVAKRIQRPESSTNVALEHVGTDTVLNVHG